MSSIFGLLPLDDASVASPVFDRSVGHAETGCAITADARIDYRNAGEARDDAAVILEAYLEHGEAILDGLLGDFAFAIWDPRERKLLCARDHFGMRPFYYHHAPGKRFVFASDARAIFQVPEVPYEINKGRVADFLVPQLEWIDYTSTFFEGVFRLPPGHKLVVTPDNFKLSEYWTPTPGPALPTMSDAEFQQGFLDVFTKAVDERLRRPQGNVGTMLSGGMDSGTVAAIASNLLDSSSDGPLHTVSAAKKRDCGCVESQRIYAAIDMIGSESTIVDPDDISDLDEQLLANMHEPFDGEFLFMKAVYLAAHKQGLDVLLDGGAGDLVLNEGAYITRLLRHGRLATAYREILAAPKFWGDSSAIPELLRYPLRTFSPEPLKRLVRPARQRRLAREFVGQSLISEELADQVEIDARCERMWQMFPGDWIADPALERVGKIRPNVSAGRERYARLAASAGLKAADPFLDLNVVAYCSQLPGHLLLRNGFPKYILREAMGGKLPEPVRWGRGKPHIGWVYNDSLIRREKSRGALSLSKLQDTLHGYVDPLSLRGAWRAFETGGNSEPVYSAYVLSRWLEQTGTRPVVDEQAIG